MAESKKVFSAEKYIKSVEYLKEGAVKDFIQASLKKTDVKNFLQKLNGLTKEECTALGIYMEDVNDDWFIDVEVNANEKENI